jgi:hypothetical protein
MPHPPRARRTMIDVILTIMAWAMEKWHRAQWM